MGRDREPTPRKAVVNEEVIREIVRAIQAIEFGHVLVTVHDGKVVQIDTTEKTRLPSRDYHERGSGI